MKKGRLASSCATMALALSFAAQVGAQTLNEATTRSASPTTAVDPAQAATTAQPAPSDRDVSSGQTPADQQGDIIVTGSARQQRRFDVSYAINSLDQAEIQRLAPQNFASLLGNLPGIQVEPTGGEVQNITRIRGIPTDDGFAVFHQDGLPLFHDIAGNFFRGDSLNRYDLMTERVEVVRGGPAPVYGSQAAAIINNITVTGTDTPHGKVQATAGTTDLYRLDAVQSGPLGERTFYAVGGFLRRDGGQRDNGFPNDRGGQIRANIKRDLDNGSVKVTANYLNDRNVFYLPIPIADPRDPAVSLDPYIDFFHGTLNSPAFRDVTLKYRDAAGVVQSETRDLADGRHMEYGNVGLQYEGEFADWKVGLNAGYTRGHVSFDALYSTSNPADANAFANGFAATANTSFGTPTTPVARLGYAIAGTNGQTAYDPYADSGLVVQAQYRGVDSDFYSGQADLNLTHRFETGFGSHDVRVGLYGSSYGLTNKAVYQDFLMEVRGRPRTLDLVAYSAPTAGAPNGTVLGYVTDKGVLRYGTTLNQGKVDTTVYAIYANDTWEVTRGLRIDGGLRQEWYHIDGFGLTSTTANLGDAATLADNAVRTFDGARQARKGSPTTTNWTIGGNYDVSEHFGGYVRASHLEAPPQSQLFYAINPVILETKANQFEAGLKASLGRNYLYVTGFYTKFDPLNSSFVPFNPQTGATQSTVPFISKVISKGVEADGRFSPVRWFSVNGSLTVQDPYYSDLEPFAGGTVSPAAVQGKQVVREPKVFGNVRPSLTFETGEASFDVYGRYEYTGRRYVDFLNFTRLPAYHSYSAGVTATYRGWQFQVVGDNLTNARGLTEGNGRTDTLSGQGTRDALYGRPVFGRSFRFIVSKSW